MPNAARDILLIEDTPDDRVYIRAVLEGAGYAVRDVADAESGLVEARRQLPLLVVMDVRLPGVDGWEACRRLKSDPLTAPVPVLVLTAVRFTRSQLADSRCDRALQKPVAAERLLEVVHRLIPTR